jgi:3-hydroxyisobutyrate dehydrogenase-like beta-hydroxyacid dehydrogenase
MRVGFVGIGTMGSGMAGCLLAAGFELTVYNRTPGRVAALLDQGAREARGLDDFGACEAVFTMVSDDAASAALMFDGGLLEAMAPGAVHVESSTVSVAHARRLAEAHAARGHGFVSAPVSGRGEAAAAGKLFVIAAGERDAFDRCVPLFDAIGQGTHYFGANPAAANAVKLAVNAMLAGTIALMAETYTMVARWGVAKGDFHDFVAGGILGSQVVKTYGGMIAEDRTQPAGFAVPLGLKDLRLALAAAEAAETAMPIASVVRDELIQAMAQGYADHDWAALGLVADNNHRRRAE